jgi:hypothetical protein
VSGCVGVSVGVVRGGELVRVGGEGRGCASGSPRPDTKDSMVNDIITRTLIHSQNQFPTHTCGQ